VEWIAETGKLIGAALVGYLASVTVAAINRKPAQTTAEAAETTAAAAMQKALSEGFGALSASMHQQMDKLSADLMHANDRLAEQAAKQDEMQRTIEEQSGEIRSLAQHVVSLENLLRSHSIDVPERPSVRQVMEFDPPPGSKIIKMQQGPK
jgi:septal ring factor EnvC (AmiA/AmiB activator)